MKSGISESSVLKIYRKNDEVEIQNSSPVCFAKSQELRDDYKL